jgi:hypothetical protein
MLHRPARLVLCRLDQIGFCVRARASCLLHRACLIGSIGYLVASCDLGRRVAPLFGEVGIRGWTRRGGGAVRVLVSAAMGCVWIRRWCVRACLQDVSLRGWWCRYRQWPLRGVEASFWEGGLGAVVVRFGDAPELHGSCFVLV